MAGISGCAHIREVTFVGIHFLEYPGGRMTQAWLNRIGTAVPPHDIHAEFIDFEHAIALFDCMVGLADTRHVIAHPTSTGGWTDNLAANTNWRTARTEAWLAFAVLTTERKAA